MEKQHSRRDVIKLISASITAASVFAIGTTRAIASDSSQIDPTGERTLILYFSQTGRTDFLANEIHKRIGGTIIEIETVVPYKGTYNELTVIAKAEQRRNHRPEIKTQLPDLSKFDTVLLGFPTWWSTMPMAMFTLLENNDFSGKTLIPFVTHGGSGLARAPKDIRQLYPQNQVLDGLAIYGDDIEESYSLDKINPWLADIGLLNFREM